jgi:hypothetical protein
MKGDDSMNFKLGVEQDNRNYWHNYRTGQDEYIETPSDFSDYVPQIGGRGMYQIHVNHYGMTPIDACVKVLEAAVGKVPA